LREEKEGGEEREEKKGIFGSIPTGGRGKRNKRKCLRAKKGEERRKCVSSIKNVNPYGGGKKKKGGKKDKKWRDFSTAYLNSVEAAESKLRRGKREKKIEAITGSKVGRGTWSCIPCRSAEERKKGQKDI